MSERERCRLVCSLGQYAWRPTLRRPFRVVWRYATTPCQCGRRTWSFREDAKKPRLSPSSAPVRVTPGPQEQR